LKEVGSIQWTFSGQIEAFWPATRDLSISFIQDDEES
jgi:hypothetical protein